MKQSRFFFFILFIIPFYSAFAQTNVGIKTVTIEGEKAINQTYIEELAYGVLNSKKDNTKDSLNTLLKKTLETELSKTVAYSTTFDDVKSISILTPEDSAFRIFNWNIPYSDGTYSYECGVLFPDSKFIFIENSEKDKTPQNWIPALYYSIISKKTKFQTYYTVLGWKGNNRLTTKKVIDVLWIDSQGDIKFGAPLFVNKNKTEDKIVFEFAAQHAMRLNYNDNLDRIEFDHLSPVRQSLTGIYEYYGPDLSYDAYQWENEKWVLKEAIYINKINADKELKKPKSNKAFEEKDFIIKESTKENKSLLPPKK